MKKRNINLDVWNAKFVTLSLGKVGVGKQDQLKARGEKRRNQAK
jgi:hypothetical protein